MNSKPHLHDGDVRTALSAIRKGGAIKDHPLCYFLSVRDAVENPHALPGDVAVHIAIRQHIITKIIERLTDIRTLYGIPIPDSACIDFHLVTDFQQNNEELEAWSLLYHRYVCIDRAMSNQIIADLTSVPERTITRRHKLGVRRLTLALIEHEQLLRRENTHEKLLLALPRFHMPPLFGAESHIETGYHVLLEAEPPCHLVLHGPTGIGKTALALTLAHRLVNEHVLSDLLWVNMSSINLAQFTEEISTRLGIRIQDDVLLAKALRAYLFAHPTLIVLDESEALISDAALCEQILSLLDSAKIVLTSRVLPASHIWFYNLSVSELKREHAFDYLDSLARRLNIRRLDRLDEYDAIWQLAGGNPLMLETLFSASMCIPLNEALSQTTDIFDQIWTQLGATERRLWLLPILCFQDGIPYNLMITMSGLQHQDTNWGLNALVNRALLYPEHASDTVYYTILAATRVFMLDRLDDLWIDSQLSAREFLQSVFEWYLPQVTEAAHGLCLLNLSVDLGFPLVDCRQYAQDVMPAIAKEGLWPAWAEALARLQTERPADETSAWASHMLGIARRWLGRFDDSRQQLTQALAYYIAAQDDIGRANCFIELSVVSRYQALWEDAQQYANSALHIYQQQRAIEGSERAIHELAQLSLERRQPAHALNQLDELSMWSARTWGIAGQAYMQLDQCQKALDAIQRALDLQPLTHPNRGRAMATLGQIQHTINQPDLAAATLSTALKLLDDSKDVVGHARVCNNLAVAYFDQVPTKRQFDIDDIRNALVEAAKIQEHIGDEIGLVVTRQNISCLFPSNDRG